MENLFTLNTKDVKKGCEKRGMNSWVVILDVSIHSEQPHIKKGLLWLGLLRIQHNKMAV